MINWTLNFQNGSNNMHARNPLNNVTNDWIKQLAHGPFRKVETFPGHFVNGYKFHTVRHGSHRSTTNSGVCVKGSNYDQLESDYYGRLLEVVWLEYPGLPWKRTALFNCEWFDPSRLGTKVDTRYKLVDINHRRRFPKYEPFVLASQATQVYYSPYPSLKRDKLDWWAVCKIKARATVEFIKSTMPPSFQEEIIDNHDYVQLDEEDEPNVNSTDVIELGDDTEEEVEDSSTDECSGSDSDDANLGYSECDSSDNNE